MAGYLVKFKGFDRDSINLSTLISGSNSSDYAAWYVEQQGKVTSGVFTNLRKIAVLAKYLLITAHADKKAEIRQMIEELNRFRSTLGPAETVIDKTKRWLSLSELEKVRLSIYPLNARRLGELTDRTRQNMQHTGCSSHGNGRRFASAVLTSLLIGLDIRIPLRQRNLREMLEPKKPRG